jgi:4-aminobutyrate aminotransferase-like enzyme
MGKLLREGLQALANKYAIIGQVRGKGLLLGVELVQDTVTKDPFPLSAGAGQLLADIAFELGLIVYPRRSINGISGDHVLIAPPLTISEAEVNEILDRFESALAMTVTRLEKR